MAFKYGILVMVVLFLCSKMETKENEKRTERVIRQCRRRNRSAIQQCEGCKTGNFTPACHVNHLKLNKNFDFGNKKVCRMAGQDLLDARRIA